MRKKSLLDKIVKKDYNNALEEILITKDYNEDVKNLLLDIFYKVETAYKDYEKVKVNVLPQEEYIHNLINAIYGCNSIKFMKPNTKNEKTFLVDKEAKEIQCYPVARKMLYSLAKIQKSDNIIKSDNKLLNETLTILLNTGNNINTVEPLRDFNGFSWNVSVSEIENIYYNFVYQNLIILVGNQFLEEWTNKNKKTVDYMELFEMELTKEYGKNSSDNIIERLKAISILVQMTIDDEYSKKILKQKKAIEKELKQYENRVEFITEVTKKKKEINKKIKEIDIILNDKDLLSEEYTRRNRKLPLEKKIFSVRVLIKALNAEREKYLLQIKKCNDLIHPKKFIERQKKLQEQEKYFRLIENDNLEESIFTNIIAFQKEIIKCIRTKVKKSTEKSELIKIIYEFRYLNLIPISNEKKVNEIEELKKDLEETGNEILIKAYELNCINIIFKEAKFNMGIMKNIFNIDVISLEDLYIKVEKEKDGYFIKIFDEDILVGKFKPEFEMKKHDLKIKVNRKTKIFNM